MEISSELKNLIQNKISNEESNVKEQELKLIEGTTVRGKIMNITPTQISISLKNKLLIANIKQLISADIGSFQNFEVNYDADGKLILNFKNPTSSEIIKDLISNTLMNLSISQSEENINNANILLNNNLAVTKENLQKLNQGTKFFGKESLSKTLFFLENNMPITSKNVTLLNDFVNKSPDISSQIQNILTDSLKLPEEISRNILSKLVNTNDVVSLKENLLKLLPDNFNNQDLKNLLNTLKDSNNEPTVAYKNEINNLIDEIITSKNPDTNIENLLKFILSNKNELEINKILHLIAKQKFHFDPKNTNSKILEQFIKNTGQDLTNSFKELNTLQTKTLDVLELTKNLSDIIDNMQFSSNIKDTIFMQLPININNHKLNSDLYIFKDSKNSNNKKRADSVSALIGLDTKNMGRVEAFLQKDNKNISLNFRLDSTESKENIEKNIYLLQIVLNNLSYNIQSLNFNKLSEPFNILTDRNTLDFNNFIEDSPLTKNSKLKFDVRT